LNQFKNKYERYQEYRVKYSFANGIHSASVYGVPINFNQRHIHSTVLITLNVTSNILTPYI